MPISGKRRLLELTNGLCTAKVSDGLELVGLISNNASLSTGDEVDVFVRPEAIQIVQDTSATPNGQANQLQCVVIDLLFNGANSTALLKEVVTGKSLHVALPQTGEYTGLQKGEALTVAWSQQQTHCFKGML